MENKVYGDYGYLLHSIKVRINLSFSMIYKLILEIRYMNKHHLKTVKSVRYMRNTVNRCTFGYWSSLVNELYVMFILWGENNMNNISNSLKSLAFVKANWDLKKKIILLILYHSYVLYYIKSIIDTLMNHRNVSIKL